MNVDIQEFSRQLGREEHSSQLLQALQALRGLDADQIPKAAGWIPWPDGMEPGVSAEVPELRT